MRDEQRVKDLFDVEHFKSVYNFDIISNFSVEANSVKITVITKISTVRFAELNIAVLEITESTKRVLLRIEPYKIIGSDEVDMIKVLRGAIEMLKILEVKGYTLTGENFDIYEYLIWEDMLV